MQHAKHSDASYRFGCIPERDIRRKRRREYGSGDPGDNPSVTNVATRPGGRDR